MKVLSNTFIFLGMLFKEYHVRFLYKSYKFKNPRMVVGALVRLCYTFFSSSVIRRTSLYYYNLYQGFLFPGTLILFCSRVVQPAKIIIIICDLRSNPLWLVFSSFILKVALRFPDSLDQAVTATNSQLLE
jgi:hypothetical protein